MNHTFLLFSLLAIPACTMAVHNDPPPPKVTTAFTTAQLYPSVSAQSDGQNLTVYAALLGDGKFIQLGSTDKLGVVVGIAAEQPLTLQPNSGSSPHYSVSMVAPTVDTTVIVHLLRANGETDSIALLTPAAFTLGATPALLQRSQSLTVQVSPAPTIDTKAKDSWIIYLSGPCVNGDVPIDATIQGSSLVFDLHTIQQIKDAPSTCAVTAKIQHQTLGKVDAAFKQPWPSDAIGVQERRFAAQLSF